MTTRSRASLCSLLLLWLCVLGAGPAPHVVPERLVARGAAELALRDVAEMPLLVARVAAAHVTTARLADRDAPPLHLATPAARVERMSPIVAAQVHAMLVRQHAAHQDRPRWRTHDAAAPPARSPITR